MKKGIVLLSLFFAIIFVAGCVNSGGRITAKAVSALTSAEKQALSNEINELRKDSIEVTSSLNSLITLSNQKNDARLAEITNKIKKLYFGNTIVTLLEQLEDKIDDLDETFDEDSQRLKEEVDAVLVMVNELLEFARQSNDAELLAVAASLNQQLEQFNDGVDEEFFEQLEDALDVDFDDIDEDGVDNELDEDDDGDDILDEDDNDDDNDGLVDDQDFEEEEVEDELEEEFELEEGALDKEEDFDGDGLDDEDDEDDDNDGEKDDEDLDDDNDGIEEEEEEDDQDDVEEEEEESNGNGGGGNGEDSNGNGDED